MKKNTPLTKTRIVGASSLLFCGLMIFGQLITAGQRGTAHPNAGGSAVPAATQIPPVDDDHDGIPDDLEQRLADRYAPIVFIEPDESNYPVNVDWFLARAHLQYHEDCFSDTDDDIGPNPIVTQSLLLQPNGGPFWHGGPNCGATDMGYGHPPHHQLTSVSPDPDGLFSVGGMTTGFADQQAFVIPDLDDSFHVGSTDPTEWKTYFHVYPSADGGIMIQYWHVFAYNELAVGNVGNHGGDWDASIQVQLDAALNIKGVWFSRHTNDHPGDFLAVGNLRLHFDPTGLHPLMSIDGGGHAAFADVFDYCDHAAPVVFTTIVYPTDLNDPTNPARLDSATSGATGCGVNFQFPGGIVWETWTGGLVRTSGQLTHAITAPNGQSTHGGMVNLGEYNPCTPMTCYQSGQASTLLAGEFHPLNGQNFIQYSGRWGSLPSFVSAGIGVGQSPRGPVFQGFVDNGGNGPNMYAAWYNQGSDVPANPANSPWQRPPSTTFSVGTPSLVSGGTTYVVQTTNYSFSASQTAAAAPFGPVTTYYRFYPQGGALPDFSIYTGPFSLASGHFLLPDGNYAVDYYSTDGLGNVEALHTSSVTLATAAPPGATTCDGVYGGSFKGNMTVSNGQVCTLFNGSVTGNVTVNPGGSFVLNNGSASGNIQLQGGGNLGLTNATVGGNVQINGGGTFAIGPVSTINGNLEIQNIPAGPAHNQICGTTVRGNLQFHNNGTAVDIGAAGCVGNSVGGNLQVQNNTAAVKIFGNTVSHSLQCSSNTPAPAGSGNSAAAKQGQCSSF